MNQSTKNALVSFIPFYGLKVYFKLGKKLGFLAWMINFDTSLFLYWFFIMNIDLEPILTILVISLITVPIQYYTIKYLINRKNRQTIDNA